MKRKRGPLEEAWSEATIAWAVCASIHREYGAGKDPFFKTRQGDYARHEREARDAYLKARRAKR